MEVVLKNFNSGYAPPDRDTNAIAINKLCKLNFWYFTMSLAIFSSMVIWDFLNMVFTFLETLDY